MVLSRQEKPRKMNALQDTRAVIVSMFLPMTLVVDTPRHQKPEIKKLDVDSIAATGPPSKYHFRSHSDSSRLPFSPAVQARGLFSKSKARSLSPPKEKPFDFKLEPSTQGNLGLHKAVESIAPMLKSKLWIGYPGAPLDDIPLEARAQVSSKLKSEHHSVPVYLTSEEVDGHYKNFCKEILWPAMHYNLPEYLKSCNEKVAWNYYVKVNEHFANVIVENYDPNDTIWVHDYHLFLVPKLVREKIPEATIGFFLHIPFPSSEVFRCLPFRKELLVGLLGSDLVGFQTYEFARHFLKTCTRILGFESTPKGLILENTVVSVGIFPIGIDPVKLRAKRDAEEVQQMITMLKEKYAGKYVIVARDKLDPIKGVRQKLLAYETFLSSFPEYQGKVVLVQVALVTTDHPELTGQVSDLVGRINSKFGKIEYTPVVYLHQDISFSHYLALLSMADVCLITSLRDGMNLTSHEYVFCQENKRSPLIISEFAGTYGSFGAALRVNPWNYREVAQAINDALSLSEEDKTKNHKELFKHVVSNTAAYWAESFITEALRVSSDMQNRFSVPIPHVPLYHIEEEYRKAKKAVFFLNYDGTLVPFEKTPHVDVSTQNLVQLLTDLTSNPKNCVYVMSGRTKSSLERHLGKVPNLGLSAENGAFIKKIGSSEWTGDFDKSDFVWQSKVMEIFDYYTERTPGNLSLFSFNL